jgi:hypothetical protein
LNHFLKPTKIPSLRAKKQLDFDSTLTSAQGISGLRVVVKFFGGAQVYLGGRKLSYEVLLF